MQWSEAKKKFILTWGQLGVSWGICRTMAQVHALLLISSKPLCADQIMEELQISRGNANMNIRALVDCGLIYKTPRSATERKEHFFAEKDLPTIFQLIVKYRKKRELDPMLNLLESCEQIQPKCADTEEFHRVVRDIKSFSVKAEAALDNLVKLDKHWISGTLFRMIK